MNEKTAQQAIFLKRIIDNTKEQIRGIEKHSFGFGTAYHDIDKTLRPVAEIYLRCKLDILRNELKNLN